MVVVDTNVIAYLMIPGMNTAEAEKLLQIEPVWLAPRLWRSEFRNVLVQYLRRSFIGLPAARQIMRKAEQLLKGHEYEVNSAAVLEYAYSSKCSAYDSEFVVLAQELNAKLVTTDKQLLRQFPDVAIAIGKYISEHE